MEVTNHVKHTFLQKIAPARVLHSPDTMKDALIAIDELEVPTTRNERWKYTRLNKIKNVEFSNPKPFVYNKNLDSISSGYRLVLVNGFVNKELSNFEAINGASIQLATEGNKVLWESKTSNFEIFDAINTTHLHEAVIVSIEPNASIEKPIEIILMSEGKEQLLNLKFILKCGKSSKAHVAVTNLGDSNSNLTNIVSEIEVEENAKFSLHFIQLDSDESKLINSIYADQEKNSTLTIDTFTLGGQLVRNNVRMNVNGENSTSNLNGVYLPTGNQHIDNHTIVDHKVPHCNSNELYKGVIDGSATGVFNGKVFVRKDAQKTNAFQSNGNVLLTDDASVYSKPELEIYADDVKCSHGSTTGQLDEEAVYYLRTRGISESNARKLLVSAFVGEVIDNIDQEEVRAFVISAISNKYGWEF